MRAYDHSRRRLLRVCGVRNGIYTYIHVHIVHFYSKASARIQPLPVSAGMPQIQTAKPNSKKARPTPGNQ